MEMKDATKKSKLNEKRTQTKSLQYNSVRSYHWPIDRRYIDSCTLLHILSIQNNEYSRLHVPGSNPNCREE
jgi:hypothetical protein